MTFVLWFVLALCAITMLACLTLLLWRRLRAALDAGGNTATRLADAFDTTGRAEDLRELGALSTPRTVDVFAGGERAMDLTEERRSRKRNRAQARQLARERTYARWTQYWR